MVEQHLSKSTPVVVGSAEKKQLGHRGMVAVAEAVGNVVGEDGGGDNRRGGGGDSGSAGL